MSREFRCHGYVLKQQPLGEHDELVTVLTLERGKLRFVAPAVKRTQSKLRSVVLPLSEIEVDLVVGRSTLPKLIRGRVISSYVHWLDLDWLVPTVMPITELILKMTPDDSPVPELYHAVAEIWKKFNEVAAGAAEVGMKINLWSTLIQSYLRLLQVAGLGMQLPSVLDSSQVFDPSAGGVIEKGVTTVLGQPIPMTVLQALLGHPGLSMETYAEAWACVWQYAEYQLETKLLAARNYTLG